MIPLIGRIVARSLKWPGQQKRRAACLLGSLLLLASGSLLSSCGGGPTVASSTGRTLYLATTGGIYGFSIMSDGTLTPVSSSPLVTGSYTQIAATSASSPECRSMAATMAAVSSPMAKRLDPPGRR